MIICESRTHKQVVNLIVFDFETAFDKVYHYILCTKLLDMDIDGAVFPWIQRFFTNRIMRVQVSGKYSSTGRVISGVPQDTCLGPQLFQE